MTATHNNPNAAPLSDNTRKFTENLGALTNITRRIALSAGHIILDYYDGLIDMDVKNKDDGSPVSQADKAADKHIRTEIEKLTPDIPIISEENDNADTLATLSHHDYFWLVDPLDGTADFIRGGNEFTVNIALIHKGKPVLGVIYAPAKEVLYAGSAQSPAIKWNEETDKEKHIHIRRPPEKGLTIVSSKSREFTEKAKAFLEDYKVKKLLTMASSLKMCTIAEGKADMYPRLGPTYEWDTAAAHAILNAAGGDIYDYATGQTITYGHTERELLNQDFIASNFEYDALPD